MHKIQFNIRHKDIEEFWGILRYFDSIETHKGIKLPPTTSIPLIEVTTIHQQCLRAQFILMLYNLIESTVVENILRIFDAIKDESLTYQDLSENLQEEWLKALIPKEGTKKTYINKTKDIISQINSDIIFPSEIKRFDGNVDLRKILEVYADLGIKFGKIPDCKELGEILLKIKSTRNDLAHGNKSYSQVGAGITISELTNFKIKTISFLEFFIDKIEAFITMKSYHKIPS